MIDKIFIVEDLKSEAEVLQAYLRMSVEAENIKIINRIDEAYQEVKSAYGNRVKIAVFIDILWGDQLEEKGITLAKNIRKELPEVKLLAYTRIGSDEKAFEKCNQYFDEIVDKLVLNPHPAAITARMLDQDFLDKLSRGEKKDNATKPITSKNYIFKQINFESVFAQLLVSDFSRYSLQDDDLQLRRFTALQTSLSDALDHLFANKEMNETMVALPTGDGIAIGIVHKDRVNAIGLKLAFRILEELHEPELSRELRIGIHYGRVYLLEGDKGELQLIGTGINKATRVQSASEPGKILISEEYYSAFIDRSPDPYCRELTVGNSIEFKIKEEPVFKARFLSRGKIGE